MWKRALLWLFLTAGGAAAAGAPWTTTRLQETVPVPVTTTTLVIRQEAGDLRLRPGSQGRIEIRSVHQHGGADGAPGWSIRRQRGRLVLQTKAGPDAVARARVDLVVRVPPDLALVIEGRDGRIEVRRHAGPIRAVTRDGAIAVSGTGPMTLRTRAGSILANLLNAPGPVPVHLRSRSGRIDLVLDAGLAWPLHLDACGLVGVPGDSGNACTRFREGQGPGIDARTRGTLTLSRVAPVLSR